MLRYKRICSTDKAQKFSLEGHYIISNHELRKLLLKLSIVLYYIYAAKQTVA